MCVKNVLCRVCVWVPDLPVHTGGTAGKTGQGRYEAVTRSRG